MCALKVDGMVNVAMYQAFHLPIFELLANCQEPRRWDISEAPLVRLFIKANRSKLTSCSESSTAVCLVEVKMGDTSKLMVVKPVGSHFALVDKACTDIESPKAWIWVAVLGISPNTDIGLRGCILHCPKSFVKKPSKLQQLMREYLDSFFGN